MCAEALRFFGLDGLPVEPLHGGEKNSNWLIDGRFVLRVYARVDPDAVAFELAAIEALVAQGFTTPRPHRGRDGELFDRGRPAALFDYVAGRHPVGDSLELGCRVAALTGRMHRLTVGAVLPGRRPSTFDPLQMIERFVTGPAAELSVLKPTLDVLRRHLELIERLAPVLPHGLVHNDISIPNVLLAPTSDEIVALLDFDDCIESVLLYDLGRIVETWGRAADIRPDQGRISALIDAYASERPLTLRERATAIDVVATYAAATGSHVLGNKIRSGQEISDPKESHSMQLFLDLVEA